jgi:hypothetical protein
MHRRRFLQLLGMSAAAAAIAPELVLDPERALWIPGQKTIFLPSDAPLRVCRGGGRGGNKLLTIEMITQEALRVLENNLTFAKFVNRQYDEQFYGVEVKVGKNVRSVKPIRFADALLLMPVSRPNLDPGTVRLYGEPSS